MTPYELFEMIAKENDDIDDIVNTTNETIKRIGQCKYAYELSKVLEEWCLERDICPLCSRSLVVIDEYSQTSECHGFPATEQFIVVGCEGTFCSYIVE